MEEDVAVGLEEDAGDIGAEGDHVLGVGEGDHGDFVGDDLLGLPVKLGTLAGVGFAAGGEHEVVVLVVFPETDVQRAAERGGVFVQKNVEEIIGVAVVANPAEEGEFVFAALGAAEVGTPFVGDDFNGDAGLGAVGLDHFGGAEGIRQVGARVGHDLEAERRFEIGDWRFQSRRSVFVVAGDERRQRIFRDDTGAAVDGFDEEIGRAHV